MKLTDVKLDMPRLEAGDWFKHPSGLELRLGSSRIPAFRARVRDLMRSAIKAERSEPDEELRHEVFRQATCELLILESRGIEGDDGQPSSPTPAEWLATLSDPAYIDLWDWVVAKVGLSDKERDELLEDSLGN